MRRPQQAVPFALLLLAGSCAALSAEEDPVARGDRLWGRRAEGFATTGKVDRAIAAGAVAAYEEALRGRPRDLAVRFKLVEALYFAGHFAEPDAGKAAARFERAVAVAEEACAQVAAAGLPVPDDAPPAAQARALAGVTGAVDAHFWAAIGWGLWGMSHNPLSAALHDVAGRIRQHAAVVAALDPAYRDAAGWRILGRLHVEVPDIPLFTGWVDRDQGVELLRRAYAQSAEDARNPLFLAEALLALRPAERAFAEKLLREVAARPPRAAFLVEDSEIAADARRALGRAARAAETP